MKKKFFYILIIIVALIVQSSMVAAFIGPRNGLDIVLMLVLAWSVIDGFNNFLPWAVTIGILYDMVSFSPIGLHVLIFLAVVYMVSFFSKRLSIDVQGTGLVLIIFFVIASVFFSQAVLGLASQGSIVSLKEFLGIFVSIKWFLIQLIYNMAAFACCFSAVRWMKKYFMLDF